MAENQNEQAAPRVSVLLVSLNDAAAVRRCLAELEASGSRESMDISVVDSGSMDECSRMDSEFPAIRMHRLPRNFGVVKALNIAMRTAPGEFFLFLEPCVAVAPNTVSELVAHLDRAPDAIAVCPTMVTPAGETVTRFRPLPTPAELYQACRLGDFSAWSTPDPEAESLEIDFVKPPVLLVRAGFMKGMRYLDERYGQHWWDLEICTQIRRASKKILLLPRVRVVVHPAAARDYSADARGLLAADRSLCAALWVGKHYGALEQWKFGMRMHLAALGRAIAGVIAFRDTGFRLAYLSSMVSGQKVDGSQRAL
jgi:GT2 family glycosyltransferase